MTEKNQQTKQKPRQVVKPASNHQITLKTGHPPFIHADITIRKIMFFFLLFLMLPTIGSVYFFGMKALKIIILSVITAIVSDLLMKHFRKKPMSLDGSEMITGLLLALVLPSEIPYYVPIAGSLFAIIIVKHIFGGLGNNIFNPALAGRAFLGASWPSLVNTFTRPYTFLSDKWFSFRLDDSIVTSATPLAKSTLESFSAINFSNFRILLDSFFGNISGSIGETSALLILMAGVALLMLKIIDWRITIPYVSTVLIGGFVLALFKGFNPLFFAMYYIFTGGILFGAVFMATDYVTSPSTLSGRWIFAIGCGLFTLVFRIFSTMPEGVMYSILLMNALTPLIDRYTFPKPFGTQKE